MEVLSESYRDFAAQGLGVSPRDIAVIGRHSRNDPLKWPDTETEVRGAYPDAPNIKIKVLERTRETDK